MTIPLWWLPPPKKKPSGDQSLQFCDDTSLWWHLYDDHPKKPSGHQSLQSCDDTSLWWPPPKAQRWPLLTVLWWHFSKMTPPLQSLFPTAVRWPLPYNHYSPQLSDDYSLQEPIPMHEQLQWADKGAFVAATNRRVKQVDSQLGADQSSRADGGVQWSPELNWFEQKLR